MLSRQDIHGFLQLPVILFKLSQGLGKLLLLVVDLLHDLLQLCLLLLEGLVLGHQLFVPDQVLRLLLLVD